MYNDRPYLVPKYISGIFPARNLACYYCTLTSVLTRVRYYLINKTSEVDFYMYFHGSEFMEYGGWYYFCVSGTDCIFYSLFPTEGVISLTKSFFDYLRLGKFS